MQFDQLDVCWEVKSIPLYAVPSLCLSGDVHAHQNPLWSRSISAKSVVYCSFFLLMSVVSITGANNL